MTLSQSMWREDTKMNPEPEELFEQNQKLVHSILWRKFPAYARDEDIRQEAMLGLWKACLSWDPSRSKFSTYSTRCILNQVYMYFRKQAPLNQQISLETPITGTTQITLSDMLEEPIPSIREEKIALKELFEGLSPREAQLVQAKLDGKTQAEIGDLRDLAQRTCSKMLTKIKIRYERSRQDDG